jgi:hypothetical protein
VKAVDMAKAKRNLKHSKQAFASIANHLGVFILFVTIPLDK